MLVISRNTSLPLKKAIPIHPRTCTRGKTEATEEQRKASTDSGLVRNFVRNSTQTAFAWVEKKERGGDFKEVEELCGPSMELLGYRKLASVKEFEHPIEPSDIVMQ